MVKIERMNQENVVGVAYLEEINFNDGWSENALREELDNESALYLVAVDEESRKVVGAAGLIQSFDEGEILNVSTMPEFRHQSIAYRIMTELVTEGKKRGIAAFTLEVREGNVPARGLYEKIGFKYEGTRPNFYTNPKEGAAIYWLR